MWWVKENNDHSRGGFQNRDVGKTNFDNDYGPDYGTDYARYCDIPNLAQDQQLFNEIEVVIKKEFVTITNLEVKVRNGFVLLTGMVKDEEIRENLEKKVSVIPGVQNVINQVWISHL